MVTMVHQRRYNPIYQVPSKFITFFTNSKIPHKICFVFSQKFQTFQKTWNSFTCKWYSTLSCLNPLIFGVIISLAIVNIKGNLVINYLISLLTKSCSRGMQLSKLNCENLTRRFFSHRRILFTPLRYISWLP